MRSHARARDLPTRIGAALVGLLIGVSVAGVPPAHAAPAGTLVFSVFAERRAVAGIYLMPAAGGTTTKTSANDRGYRPRWAPDGSGFAYIGAFGSIRWVDADGSNDRQLVPRSAFPRHFRNIALISWSPDGSLLLLTVYDEGYRRTRLFTADAATADVQLLLRDAGDADWSSTNRIVMERRGRVVTMDPDTTNRAAISTMDVNWLRWSPDGNALAFMHNVHRSADIYVMGADGSDPTNLTTSKAYDWSPSWSPDGSMIVWSRSPTISTRGDLFEMQADGTGVVRLTSTKNRDEFEPGWTA